MTFYFSAYSTPLLFGFVQAWIYAVLLWVRGRREERLSDRLLGWVLVALAFQIWIYMLGFGGIEVFWNELNFFPRTLTFLLPPLFYFYLRAQFDARFRFHLRDTGHALPFVVDTGYRLLVFARGPAFVRDWEENVHNNGIDDLEFVGNTVQHFVYLYWSFQLYKAYRRWTKTQFSDTDAISFRWFRNFLIALTITLTFNVLMTLVDLWLALSFWQDWWGNLVGAILIYYVSIEGYAQPQAARQLRFDPEISAPLPVSVLDSVPVPVPVELSQKTEAPVVRPGPPVRSAGLSPPDLTGRMADLRTYMATEKPYLESALSLTDLARRLLMPPVLLSQVINAGAGRNFNDFVNAYRVDEFKRQVQNPANGHLSFLGLALDCGFNSKATFNRAFRKYTGEAPKEFVEKLGV